MPASPLSRIYLARIWTVICLALWLGTQQADAHSVRPGPLKRIFHPRKISTVVIPRAIPQDSPHNPSNDLTKRKLGQTWRDGKQKRSLVPQDKLLPSDALRLSFDIPSTRRLVSRSLLDDMLSEEEAYETVHLHMTPTEHLFHPQAKINYVSSSGEVLSSEPLRAHDHRVYTGEVIGDWSTAQRLEEDRVGGVYYPQGSEDQRGVRGTATIHVHNHHADEESDRPAETKFQGAFYIDGQLWHVMTKENYLRHAQEGDAQVMEVGGPDSGLVMFMEGDEHDAENQPFIQSSRFGAARTGCSHDNLDFNTNATVHPVLKERPRHPHSANQASAPFFPSLPSIPLLDSFSPLLPFQQETPRRSISRRDDISTGGNARPSSNYIGSIGQTTGCPTEQRVVYMGVAADCNYISTYGGTEQARTQILTNWNSITALYRSTFNVSLGIIELNVMNETCPSSSTASSSSTAWNTPCSDSVTLNDRLSLFSEWRGRAGNGQAGLYHLMTSCPTDTEVGVAWLGTLCQTDSTSQSGSTVSGTGVSSSTRTEWPLISHEIGHNFGAIHDCSSGCTLTSSCCPLSTSACNAGAQYIMHPTTSSSEVAFSPCSIGNICSVMNSRAVDTSCIVVPGSQRILSLASCGNGIVEDGEDCDPGSNASSSCCDASTCKFVQGAVCDPATDLCCTNTCGFANNSTLCRASKDEACDLAEYCTGSSRSCPKDETRDDGLSCGSNGLACASGQCTSKDLQCQTVGSALNLTRGCSQKGDTSCVVSCQSPDSANSCLVLQSPLIDGSPCGYGGHCYNQTCQTGNTGDTIESWIDQNLQIAIPVIIVGSLLVLGILFWIGKCIFGACFSRRPSKKATVQSMPQRYRGNEYSQSQPLAPLPPAQTSYPAHSFNQDQSGNHGYAYPPPPNNPHGHYPMQQRNNAPMGGWVNDQEYNGPNFRH